MKVRNYLLDFVGIHKYCRHKAEIKLIHMSYTLDNTAK